MEELFIIEITATKAKAKKLETILEAGGHKEAELPPLPIGAIGEFIDGERKTLYEITLGEEIMMKAMANVDGAKCLRGLMKSEKLNEFPLPAVTLENIKDFLAGDRDNILSLEMKRTKVKKEDLPGHV